MIPKYVKVCVIGLGPAGLGAALRLARSSLASETICIEAGVSADKKFCSILQGKGCRKIEPCQMISGVGGSSVLSGGKISTFPAGRAMANIIGDLDNTQKKLEQSLALFKEFVPLYASEVSNELCQKICSEYSELGFEFRHYNSFLYQQADLVRGYTHMLEEIIGSGVSVSLGTKVINVIFTNQGFRILCKVAEKEVEFFSTVLVLAGGRLGVELLENVYSELGLELQLNHCDLGVRIEFPSSIWPDINEAHNDLKLHFGDARTFCVCKDGFLAPYRLKGIFLLEGSADPIHKTGFTNLAISVRQQPHERIKDQDLFSEIRRRMLSLTGGMPIRQRLEDFLANQTSIRSQIEEPSSIAFWKWANANDCFPQDISSKIRDAVEYFVSRLIPAKYHSLISVFAPEIDYYWPRSPLTQGFLSQMSGLYIIGDSTGQFRGILQAFCSGLECANHIFKVNYVS